MVNYKASPVVPLPAGGTPDPLGVSTTLARDFHFAVTWITIFAHLDPIEATGPRPSAVAVPREPVSLALVPVPAIIQFAPDQEASEDISDGWEMVVPKMLRTGPGNFTPAESRAPERL
jgi:hypothetical protein